MATDYTYLGPMFTLPVTAPRSGGGSSGGGSVTFSGFGDSSIPAWARPFIDLGRRAARGDAAARDAVLNYGKPPPAPTPAPIVPSPVVEPVAAPPPPPAAPAPVVAAAPEPPPPAVVAGPAAPTFAPFPPDALPPVTSTPPAPPAPAPEAPGAVLETVRIIGQAVNRFTPIGLVLAPFLFPPKPPGRRGELSASDEPYFRMPDWWKLARPGWQVKAEALFDAAVRRAVKEGVEYGIERAADRLGRSGGTSGAGRVPDALHLSPAGSLAEVVVSARRGGGAASSAAAPRSLPSASAVPRTSTRRVTQPVDLVEPVPFRPAAPSPDLITQPVASVEPFFEALPMPRNVPRERTTTRTPTRTTTPTRTPTPLAPVSPLLPVAPLMPGLSPDLSMPTMPFPGVAPLPFAPPTSKPPSDCDCATGKPKEKKKRKKREPRVVCRRGTYEQTARGIIYRPKEIVPCQ